MRFAVAKEHYDFFYQNHYLELEELLSSETCNTLLQEIKQCLTQKLSAKDLEQHPFEQLYLSTRDFSRACPALRSVVTRSKLAEIASNLTKTKPIRLAYDQLMITSEKRVDAKQLPDLFKQDTSLMQTSSFQDLLCGLILHLSPEEISINTTSLSIEDDLTTICPLPKRQGSGTFFSSSAPVFFEELFQNQNQVFLLLAYGTDPLIYSRNDRDPNTHELKKLSYTFGDKLRLDTHPIFYCN